MSDSFCLLYFFPKFEIELKTSISANVMDSRLLFDDYKWLEITSFREIVVRSFKFSLIMTLFLGVPLFFIGEFVVGIYFLFFVFIGSFCMLFTIWLSEYIALKEAWRYEYNAIAADFTIFKKKQEFCEYARGVLGWFLPVDWDQQQGAMFVADYIGSNRLVFLFYEKEKDAIKEFASAIVCLYPEKREDLLKTLMSYSIANNSYFDQEKTIKRIAHYLHYDKESYEDILESVYCRLRKDMDVKIPYFLGKCDSDSYRKYAKRYKKYEAEFSSNGKQRFFFNKKQLYFFNKKPEVMDVALRLFAAVVKADRQEMVCEIDVVRDFVRKNDRKHFSQRMNEFSQYLNYDYVVEDIALAAVWFHKDSVAAIMQTMVSMAYADLDFCDAEMVLLRRAASAMHINHDEFEKMVKIEAEWAETEKKRKEDEEAKKGYWSSDAYGNRKFNHFSESGSTGDTAQSQLDLPYELLKAYDVLGMPYTASISEIKASKRNLMRINHPDVVANRGAEAVEAATIKCQEINKAFEVVKKYRNI